MLQYHIVRKILTHKIGTTFKWQKKKIRGRPQILFIGITYPFWSIKITRVLGAEVSVYVHYN